MKGRGSRQKAARLLCAAAATALGSGEGLAQAAPPLQSPTPPDAAELDPSAPLASLPDLGVDWPDLNARDQTQPQTAAPGPKAAGSPEADGRYGVAIEGVGPVLVSEDVLTAVGRQSARE